MGVITNGVAVYSNRLISTLDLNDRHRNRVVKQLECILPDVRVEGNPRGLCRNVEILTFG